MILPNRDILWTVEPECVGLRMDRYLMKRMHRFSRELIQGWIKEGLIQIQSVPPGYSRPERVKVSTPVYPGMEILMLRSQQEAEPLEVAGPREPLTILAADDHVLVVDKPAGMLVHPAGFRVHNTVIMELKRQFGTAEPLSLGHRLDRDTSGVLIVGRGAEADRVIKAHFKARRVQKAYLAVVRGEPSWESTVCDLPLGDGDGAVIRVRQVARPDGAASETAFRVIRRLPGHALVECLPHTGRLHQIRVHLEALGHPIVGDQIYGTDGTPFLRFRAEGMTPELEAELGHWRQALHAHWLEMPHPHTGVLTRWTAPLALDLVELVERLASVPPPAEPSLRTSA